MTSAADQREPPSPDAGALPEPIHFVFAAADRWREHVDASADPDAIADVINRFGGAGAWVLQTLLRLRHRGVDARLSARFVPGAVCVAHYDNLAIREPAFRSFVVAVQADRGRPELCHMRIVQNPACIVDPATDHYLPGWPQPGLLPRESPRGERVERVGFVGRPIYLAPAFRDDAFRGQLAAMGMELVIRDRQWNDYHDLDVILAVRDCTPFDLGIKPVSKLANAWLAGCPALLGPEPAYRFFRGDALDYIEIETPDEAVAALRRLRDEPGLFTAMRERARERALHFTVKATTDRWISLLAGPIAETWSRWRRSPTLLRDAAGLTRYPIDAWRHRRRRREFHRLIHKPETTGA